MNQKISKCPGNDSSLFLSSHCYKFDKNNTPTNSSTINQIIPLSSASSNWKSSQNM